ncbi:conserved protein, unknown function [Plasmodium vinckei vinckei]|uniref:Transmembrane protein 43 n=1 Tax=Plasmodium vinckei vinckei TaxID=54757 RepID=A0A449BY75_PLAVN|nr:conserved protein, unknown function [Plasmodium vinckei vinckei]KEG04782.1 hypothetical protein YYE_00357 [Plasmodium vinckei vinckei]VEV58435.1 conserved protein, unknown function [Plasmodium vinckei vinckei]
MVNYEDFCFRKNILSIYATSLTIILLIFTILNEYKYIRYSKELKPIIKNAIRAPCIPLDENNGKIIHINCPLQDQETFYAPSEFSSNIYSFRGIFFETKVEMYQWVGHYGYLGLFSKGKFEDHIVKTPYNFHYFYKNRRNPTYIPTVGGIGRKYASYAKVGNYRLLQNSLINFQKKKKLDLIDDGWFTESEIKPPFTIDHLNTNVYDNYLYTGDPLNPQVGDIRVSFYGNASTHATAIGIQKARLLNTIFEIDTVNIMNKDVILLSEDNKIMTDHTKNFIYKNYGNKRSLWVFRIIAYIFLFIQIFIFLENTSKNVTWKLIVSSLVSMIILSIFPCVLWIFCDTAVFLCLFVFIVFLSIALLFIYNNEIDNGYTEMKNYMKRANTEPTSYTFLNVEDNCTDIYKEYTNEKDKIGTILDSSSDVSFYNSINKNDGHKFESSPAGVYQYR